MPGVMLRNEAHVVLAGWGLGHAHDIDGLACLLEKDIWLIQEL